MTQSLMTPPLPTTPPPTTPGPGLRAPLPAVRSSLGAPAAAGVPPRLAPAVIGS
jgi:hypothetical protein